MHWKVVVFFNNLKVVVFCVASAVSLLRFEMIKKILKGKDWNWILRNWETTIEKHVFRIRNKEDWKKARQLTMELQCLASGNAATRSSWRICTQQCACAVTTEGCDQVEMGNVERALPSQHPKLAYWRFCLVSSPPFFFVHLSFFGFLPAFLFFLFSMLYQRFSMLSFYGFFLFHFSMSSSVSWFIF